MASDTLARGLDVVDPDTGAGWAIAGTAPEAYALSHDGSLLALSEGGLVTLWDLCTVALRHKWSARTGKVTYEEGP